MKTARDLMLAYTNGGARSEESTVVNSLAKFAIDMLFITI
jgi:hypothetical protein